MPRPNRPTDCEIENLFQDASDLFGEVMTELGNKDIEITDDTCTEWLDAYRRLDQLCDDVTSLRKRSGFVVKDADREHIPIYGVTNGRGRIIA